MSTQPGFPPHGPPPPDPRTQQLPPQGAGTQGPGPQGPGPQGPGPQGPPPGRHHQPFGPDQHHSGPGQQFGPPNQQFGPPNQPFGPPTQRFGGPDQHAKSLGAGGAIWLLGLVGLVAIVLGLSIDEDGRNAWETVHAWGALAIAGSLLTLAPVALTSLSRQRAWQVSACGAGALVLFWVLFTLPDAGSNTSLAITVGVACGVIATWIAPGRDVPGPPQERPHAW